VEEHYDQLENGMTRAEAQASCPRGISWQKLRKHLLQDEIVEETRRQFRANGKKKETCVYKLTESFKLSNDIVMTTKKKRVRIHDDSEEEDQKRPKYEKDDIEEDK
jgi:hypothetical protein